MMAGIMVAHSRNNVLCCIIVLNACAVVLILYINVKKNPCFVIVESTVTDDGRYNCGSFKCNLKTFLFPKL